MPVLSPPVAASSSLSSSSFFLCVPRLLTLPYVTFLQAFSLPYLLFSSLFLIISFLPMVASSSYLYPALFLVFLFFYTSTFYRLFLFLILTLIFLLISSVLSFSDLSASSSSLPYIGRHFLFTFFFLPFFFLWQCFSSSNFYIRHLFASILSFLFSVFLPSSLLCYFIVSFLISLFSCFPFFTLSYDVSSSRSSSFNYE